MKIHTAIDIANTLLTKVEERPLNDIEVILLKGVWERLDYDQIAAQNQYSTSYISQDVAPKLWKLLSKALGNKVRKSNIRSLLQQHEAEVSPPKAGAIPAPQTPSAEHNSTPNLTRSASRHLIYIERPPLESICYKTLMQPGALLRIKAPRFMGKTALMHQVMSSLDTTNYQVGHLSFELADHRTHLSDPSKLLQWFCINLGASLGVPNKLNEYWDEEFFGAKVSCTQYLEQHLLPAINKPIILALDDIDVLFPHTDVSIDFFGLLRSWYEKAKYQAQWQNLRFILAHSTDIYVKLQINQSPFNIGVSVEPPEFTEEQTLSMAQAYDLPQSANIVKAIMPLIGGHPYLLLKAFKHVQLNDHAKIETILQEATTEMGIFGDHLRNLRLTLDSEPDIKEAFLTLIHAQSPQDVEAKTAYRLQNMGLIRNVGKQWQPRCKLYQRYFQSIA